MATTISDGTTSYTPLLVTGWETIRTAQNVLHPIIGREDVAVTLRPAGLRKGTLEMLAGSLSDALAIEALCAQESVLTVTEDDLPSLAMSFVASGDITMTLDDETRNTWSVGCDFQEVVA